MFDPVIDWLRARWVALFLWYKHAANVGLLDYLNHGPSGPKKSEETVLLPFDEDLRNKKWVVIKDTEQIAVIDHIKPDGRLGVRPVDPITAAYYPNTSEHWSWDDRIRIPHELSLPPGKIREATKEEVPYIVRK